MLTDTVVPRRLTAGTPDKYGNAQPVYVELPPLPARIEHTVSTENIDNRAAQFDTFRVFLPAGVDLTGNDELEWVEGGLVLRIQGDPLPMQGARAIHHVELTAYRVTG